MPRRKTTRKTLPQPRSHYPATVAILLICLLVQIACELFPSLRDLLCLTSSQPWGILTYQFAHAHWPHFIGNFMFGLPFLAFLESRIGGRRLVLWYVLSGAISALFFWLMAGMGGGLIGASGSLSGVFMAVCLTFGKAPVDKCIGAVMGMTMLSMQVLLAATDMFSGVAYWGHVGGMICGALLVLGDLWKKPSKRLSR